MLRAPSAAFRLRSFTASTSRVSPALKSTIFFGGDDVVQTRFLSVLKMTGAGLSSLHHPEPFGLRN
jgi:hypothetical protein